VLVVVQAPDPESIMLSTMTQDSDEQRTEREVLVPWLKFLWETYRNVLELLKSSSDLEKVIRDCKGGGRGGKAVVVLP
jgi:hypothetical protein